ncbi:DUF1134 domain-containing protein [Thiococcus pfennigii]|jgi:hypothetical protein|uniref:DUF1134 domain-containing protein n=1 Tax=Thiococcus pfennigii TaxID=1057 RepID=UPI001903A7B0|nr:DUF1134 domain-containing protein [Thiococcus pfennigii]MBK1699603.1 hypothetical protein [Thiococcus pfennigii]MBK1731777.1 hypothetical protein [Thiococcus pfennigii]
MHRLPTLLALLWLAAIPAAADELQSQTQGQTETYKEQEILASVENFFGQGAANLADVVRKVFKEQGEPNAYITGEEIAGALAVGLRYGKGTLHMKPYLEQPVYWQGPSIGFDIGLNVSKVFVLIYDLPDPEALYQRFPGIEGSLYFVGGVGVNYLQSDGVVIAPIRFGAGWRQGLSAGYMDFTKHSNLNPF